MIKIAIFASGSGSNAENIIKYFMNSDKISVGAIFCNNKNAEVICRAQGLGVDCYIFNKVELNSEDGIIKDLKRADIDYIILAGFLNLIPTHIVQAYSNRILNIHPSLMPKFCGHGMYGMKVHQAVVDAKESESGITIHKVNEKYDEGAIIFQAKCPVYSSDNAEDVAHKIHNLEYEHFPKIIEHYILSNN